MFSLKNNKIKVVCLNFMTGNIYDKLHKWLVGNNQNHHACSWLTLMHSSFVLLCCFSSDNPCFCLCHHLNFFRPRGYKAWVHSQTQNKVQWLADCGHVSAISQSLRFILSLRMYSSFITLRPGVWTCIKLNNVKKNSR